MNRASSARVGGIGEDCSSGIYATRWAGGSNEHFPQVTGFDIIDKAPYVVAIG